MSLKSQLCPSDACNIWFVQPLLWLVVKQMLVVKEKRGNSDG